MLNKIKLNYPNDTESCDNVHERTIDVKKYIAQYLQEHKLTIEESVNVISIVIIIAHNFFIFEYLQFDWNLDVTKKSRIVYWQFVNDSKDYSMFWRYFNFFIWRFTDFIWLINSGYSRHNHIENEIQNIIQMIIYQIIY